MSESPDQLGSSPPVADPAVSVANRLGVKGIELMESTYTIGSTAVYGLGQAGGLVANSQGESVDISAQVPEHVRGRPDNMYRYEVVGLGEQILRLADEGDGIKPGAPLTVTQRRRGPRSPKRGAAYLEASPVEFGDGSKEMVVGFDVTWQKSLPKKVFDVVRRKQSR